MHNVYFQNPCLETPRKTVLNVLAHMGVFGSLPVKAGAEEETE